MTDRLDRGRDAFDRRAWGAAYRHLAGAAAEGSLEVVDLERLASAAYLVGRSDESSDLWAQAHHECARLGDVARAARCAFWLAFALLNAGELERGGGWVDRAQRLLDGRKIDCVEQGYLRYAAGLRCMFTGDGEKAFASFSEASAIGDTYQEAELVTLARIAVGRCLIYGGDVATGVALLDEAMVAVESEELSPIAVGDAYCTVIDGCVELFDVRRAKAWTVALSRWCDEQPELVLYRSECLVHRAEIMQLHGDWTDALDELERYVERLAAPGDRMLGAVEYLRGDLHRLRGTFADAERAYRAASALSRDVQPGMALLRLAQGRVTAADAAIRRALDETEGPMARARLLGPFVEIMLAAGDVAAARAAAAELDALATAFDQPLLRALAATATGRLLLVENDGRSAAPALRRAWAGWRDLDAPYEAARARVQLALACRALGDDDGAEMELDAARIAFVQLGAGPDVAAVEALSSRSRADDPSGLTAREREVLCLVAAGHSNRQIADDLFISEKTVASHLTHIFTKLEVTSRTAAAAYAHQHGLA